MRAEGSQQLNADAAEALTKFVLEHVKTSDELEVLLILVREPDREWSLEALADRSKKPLESYQAALVTLAARGFVSLRSGFACRYQPVNEALASGVRLLSDSFLESPADVLRILSQQALDRVKADARQTFVEARQTRAAKPSAGKE